jgi:quercetin dioxygenase-like cupin family protein
MPVIRSRDRTTTSNLAQEGAGPAENDVFDRIAGFQGYAERTLIDQEAMSEALTMGDLVFEPGAVVPGHHHEVQEAFYVFEGSGTVIVGGEEFELSVGDSLLVPSGVSHAFRNESGRPWRMVWAYAALDAATYFD